MVHAFDGVDFDVGFLVPGEVDVGEDEQCLRAVGDIEGAIKTHGLHAAFFASSLAECVGESYGLVVNLVGQMRRQQRDGQRNRRFDFHAEFLVVVVGRHQAVNFGRRCHFIFFIQDAAPVETGLHAVVHATPTEVLDVKIIGRN